ncbi:hypothetical protein GRF29_1536g274141 [Pseudopithomyces chartarum]|uniref:Uncharacterized protein n=1 Tax=Pseudopithomyces chartarum TaxID=1892770 RepID=A0AAN6RBY8_9PLEO|nr:hypothetical protein GRF29_1536g274141 [Pseudopithomyces chartarum]
MASSNTNKTVGATSQVTSRHRTRQAHISINEHETADQNISDDMDVDNASADDETESVTMQASEDGTQGLTDDVQKRLGEMRANRKERNAARKLIIHKTYDVAYAETKEAINSCFDASEYYDAQLARLKDLIEKKTQVETLMAEKLSEMRSKYLKVSKALEKVLEYRIKQLN